VYLPIIKLTGSTFLPGIYLVKFLCLSKVPAFDAGRLMLQPQFTLSWAEV